jgi:adenine-specific DNA-methyltransferase
MVDKLKMQAKDIRQKNIETLLELFPFCKIEVEDSQGSLKNEIDFDVLKYELGCDVSDSTPEKYQLTWPGKKAALVNANSQVNGAFRPCPEESLNFYNTENIFIEGDNLEALKLLQNVYLDKVKMIYIDPPYNTGNDFIYSDNFTLDEKNYSSISKQKDSDGNLMLTNTESNGRFHSDWLSMMYSRLKLARKLLRDDGVIFISIDDNEVSNLRKICDEIFGSNNFYCNFIWQKRSGSMDSVDGVSNDHEYILAYGKSKSRLKGVQRTYEKYSNPDNDPRGPWISDNLSAGKPGGDVYYSITDPANGNRFNPPPGRFWPYSRVTMQKKIEEGRVLFPKEASGRPSLKRFQYEAKSQYLPVSTLMRNHTTKLPPGNAIFSAMNTKGTSELQALFGEKVFSFPKSTVLISSLIGQVCDDGDLVMDFFAGSGTTPHSVMDYACKNRLKLKYIAVQLAEKAHGNFETIAEITKERIRRAGVKIKEDHSGSKDLDVGFRVLKIDSSNMNEVYYTPDTVSKSDLLSQVEHIKADRTAEDLLFQVMLDWGVDLSLPIRKVTIEGKEVYFVNDDDLIACFDKDIDEPLIKALAAKEPLRIVFRDDGFASDSLKINVEQIFKQLAPFTDIKVI